MTFNLKKLNKLSFILALIIIFLILLFGNRINIFYNLSNKVDMMEGTEVISLDNWEISTVFYDSTVDGGVTPLTEINWDASDGSYKEGETRVITIQINYKNTNTIKTYAPGDLEIHIPNLSCKYSPGLAQYANWDANLIVGANDNTHTGYEWNFKGIEYEGGYYSLKERTKTLIFTNANTIEAGTNFEGSIQITYTITPSDETPEEWNDDCIHNLKATIQAALLFVNEPIDSSSKIIATSPNYPNNYPDNMNPEDNYQEYTIDGAAALKISFLKEDIDYPDRLYAYDKFGNMVMNNYNNEGIHFINGDYVKIGMYSDNEDNGTGFRVQITPYKGVLSNTISFNYTRTYIHPWEYKEYPITLTAEKITSWDNLSKDYYWVKYKFKYPHDSSTSGYPYIPVHYWKFYIYDEIPEDCIVYDLNFNKIEPIDGKYILNDDFDVQTASGVRYIYVGYPKKNYNEENNNLEITNTGKAYGYYANNLDDLVYLSSDSVTINLNEFEFTYTGELYSLKKGFSADNLYYQSLTGEDINIGDKGTPNFSLNPMSIYTGTPLTVRFGDDLLYITDENSNYRRLEDEEYYFSNINFRNYNLENGHGNTITEGKYNCELWVRYAGTEKYILYEKFTNGNGGTTTDTDTDGNGVWNFTKEQKIVGFYFQINDMTESIKCQYSPLYGYVKINNSSNIAKTGTIYNFSNIQIFTRDNNGSLVLQNEPSIDSYSNMITKNEIAQFDQNTYGTYIQRSCNFVNYSYFVADLYNVAGQILWTENYMVQDAANERFIGTNKLEFSIDDNFIPQSEIGPYYDQLSLNQKYVGFELYHLLPDGVELISNEDEIINNISSWQDSATTIFKAKNVTMTAEEYASLVKEHAQVEIVDNYKGTNRTLIYIKSYFPETPLAISVMRGNARVPLQIDYEFSVPYDAYYEYGSVFTFRSYAQPIEREWGEDWGASKSIIDNGTYDINEKDIDNDGDITEKFTYSSGTITITSVVSTHQDLTTYVQTDQSNYSTGVVNASYGSNYEYKLRTRTGANDITNLVIYSNLEEGHNNRGHWYGEFLGIDTSYAESKGYTIKTYYSENKNASTLEEDNTWKVYDDTVDKTKVKSLAFEYLDSEGNPAILPTNSLTYVLIKMKAPSDENIKTLAYNSSWTQWNAIDPITKLPVDFITGINSNVVKVSLPNSVEYADIELNLEKVWNDNNNEKGLRPSTLKYLLITNDDETTATEIMLNTNDINPENINKWSKTIEVPKYDDDGNEINYSIKEISPTLENNYKYVPTINGFSITNTLSKELTITKKWIDNNNSYLTRPSNVTIKVLQNNKDYKDVVITGNYSTNEWANKITVPVYDSEGNEYVYTLKEEVVENYSSTYDSDTYTFTNILTGEEKIKVTKKWLDNSNSYTTRPSSVTVKLKQNDKDYQSLTLTGTTNTWISDEILVPKYDSNGIKYTYTIEEDVLVNGYGIIEYDQKNLIVTNTLKQNIEITITKKWLDNSNSYNTRPNNLEITLLQNNKVYKTITLNGNTDTWTSTIEVPKYDSNQQEYKYTIKESNESIITEYSDVNYSNDGLSVTNKLKKDINLTITKKWIDYDNEYKTRSSTVKINLYRNGTIYKELELSGEANAWSTKVEQVPAYDDNGRKYSYTIEEVTNDKLKKYQKITYDQTTLTVTNELTEKPKVTLYFTVKNGYTEAGENEVKFDEEGLKNILEKHNINPDEEYLYKFELENIETGEKYEGSLSTQGVLEFPDLPYGTYKAVEGEDEYFSFVNMLNIEDIPGVTFTEEENGGLIKIEPTGEDIIYGVNVTNKIKAPGVNPETKSGRITILVGLFVILVVCMVYFIGKKKEF